MALYTGFRRKELAALTTDRLDLQVEPAVIKLSAKHTKNGKEARLELHPALAELLRSYLAQKPKKKCEPILPLRTAGGNLRRTSKMMQADLTAGRKNWLEEAASPEDRSRREESDFLRYVDAEGLFADFHSNRHTFVTWLIQSGASPKAAQSLARHGNLNLTFNTYTHAGADEQSQAIRNLPVPTLLQPVSAVNEVKPSSNSEAGKLVPLLVPTGDQIGAQQVSLNGNEGVVNGSLDSTNGRAESSSSPTAKSREAKGFGSPWQELTSPGNEPGRVEKEVHPRGLEPLTFGSVDRRRTNVRKRRENRMVGGPIFTKANSRLCGWFIA